MCGLAARLYAGIKKHRIVPTHSMPTEKYESPEREALSIFVLNNIPHLYNSGFYEKDGILRDRPK